MKSLMCCYDIFIIEIKVDILAEILTKIFAQILTEIRSKVDQLVPEPDRQTCADCISDFQLVAGQLRSLVYRTMCPVLIVQNQVIF